MSIFLKKFKKAGTTTKSHQNLLQRIWKFLEVPEKFDSTTVITTTAGGVTFTMNEYFAWEKEMAKKYPVRYFITETIPDHYDMWCRRIRSAYWWVRYRTTNRNHILKIHSLEPGWHDRDTRMLHACFQLLIDYIEIELPRREYRLKSAKARRASKGLELLDEMIEDPSCHHGPSPTQAEAAQIKKDLYLWWTETRAKRIEAWADPLIWTDEAKAEGTAGEQASYLEHCYDEEDQLMLKRLISVRNTLWS